MHLANSNAAPGEERLPRLSIVIPTLDEEANLGALLRSLRPADGRPIELIVSDGGSRDGTREIARIHADKVIDSARGRALQMNAGAAAATGDILLFLHADTRLPANYAQLLTEQFWCSGRQWGRFDVRLSGGHRWFRVIERFMNARSALTGIATGDQAIFVRRSLFLKLGGFAPLPLMEDIALSRCLKRVTRPFRARPTVLVSSRKWEREGILRTVLLMWALRLAYAAGADPARLARHYYGR